MSDTTRDLVILGAGGHSRELLACLRASSGRAAEHRLLGFLDDNKRLHGTDVGGLPVLGGLGLLTASMSAILGVGYPEAKLRIWRRTGSAAGAWPSLVAASATLGERIELGEGVFIQEGCVLTADIGVGDFATINVGATISHDCHMGRFVTVSPGAHVGGNVSLGEGAFIGIGANVMQGVSIGEWSLVGAGAAVIGAVPPNTVVAGVPARVIKTRKGGWQDD